MWFLKEINNKNIGKLINKLYWDSSNKNWRIIIYLILLHT